MDLEKQISMYPDSFQLFELMKLFSHFDLLKHCDSFTEDSCPVHI